MPVKIEVVIPLPEGWGLCTSCEMLLRSVDLRKSPAEVSLDELPPEWQEELQRLAALISGLAERYGDSIRIHILDPRSLRGLVKSVRYNIRRYPAFVVSGSVKIEGWNSVRLEQAILQARANLQDEINK